MATLGTDTFNRADENPVAGWTLHRGQTAVVSNMAQRGSGGSSNNECVSVFIATWPADQWSEAEIGATPAFGEWPGPAVRMTTIAPQFSKGYIAIPNNSNDTVTLYDFDTGSFTLLGAQGAALSAADLLYLKSVGTDITIQINGATLLSLSNGTYASGDAGMFIYALSDVASGKVNAWRGGDHSADWAPSAGALSVSGIAAALRYAINMPDEL